MTDKMDVKDLPGSLKIAILVQALNRDAARSILSNLSAEERELVSTQISQMGPVSPELVEKVAGEFAVRLKQSAPQTRRSRPAAAPPRHGTDQQEASEESALRAIRALDAEQIYNLIKAEHPQTIAIVLVHLKTDVAAEVLAMLPVEIKTDVAVRVAKLDKVYSGMVEEIDRIFEEIVKHKKNSVMRVNGGIGRLAEMLNQTDEDSNTAILNDIQEKNPELADQIKEKMFLFEDLVLVDDRGFQKLLRRVETAELATALKAASEDVKAKVFHNMSNRAGDMLREEIEDLGPLRMTEVVDAQKKITALIQEMELKGELIISGRRGEEFI
jgi:flagellar motor switch protein FliG